jgi:glycolate oxidase FAD binding subunit
MHGQVARATTRALLPEPISGYDREGGLDMKHVDHNPSTRPDHAPLVPPGGIEHHVRDMTATISADVPLRDVQARLAEHGQWLPIDGDAERSVGQLVETNSTGPLRLGYGAWRDLMLGAQFLNGRGELITAGGRTVKNVAGYDLTKFMVGQRGVFGKLVTITTRTWRRPAAAMLAQFPPSDRTLNDLMPTAARPQWAILTAEALWCGYLGDARAIDFYQTIVPKYQPSSVVVRSEAEDIVERARLWYVNADRVAKVSVPPTKILQFVRDASPQTWVADAAFGIVLCPAADAGEAKLRTAAQNAGGSMYVRGVEPGDFDVPASPVERRIIERLKQVFDPDAALTPITWQS